MRDMWDMLGFKASPYNAEPLAATAEDADLLVARQKEGLRFCTTLESSDHGVLVLSGSPGVGKTSFLNVQQYLLETGKAQCGPRVMAARQLCPIQPGDTPKTIALRAAQSMHRSILEFCSVHGKRTPKQTKKIGKWINASGGSGLEIGIQVLGSGANFGRQVEVPNISDVSFEGIRDVISTLAEEIATSFGLSGSIVALDNIENLDDDVLSSLLISLRDTLFSLRKIWWILIGQKGLASLIQTLDPRVSERIAGSGLDLEPVSFKDLHEAIERRVAKFHSSGLGKAPLPESIHKHLYQASNGEIRFVFRYSNTICIKFVEQVRDIALRPGFMSEVQLNEILGNAMTAGVLKEKDANSLLRDTVIDEFKGLGLKPKDKQILRKIGQKGRARPKDFKDYGLGSIQDFSSNYLSRFHKFNFLVREQEGKAAIYRLRGLARLADEYNLLK